MSVKGTLLRDSVEKPILVITTCTSRKRRPISLSGSALGHDIQKTVELKWLAMVAKALPAAIASDLYSGRAFALAKRSAASAKADLAIISAGLGLVLSTERIPSYDLTLSRGGIRSTVSDNFDEKSWWQAISASPYSVNLNELAQGRTSVLVCLSASYSAFLEDDLEGIARISSLRIFGAGLAAVLRPNLRQFVLPYDSRLDFNFCNGTQMDFAQRSLLHYITKIKPLKLPCLSRERSAVLAAFEGSPMRSIAPKRLQLDDDDIRDKIVRLIPIVGKKRSSLLHYLRHNEHIACEQNRFARIFNEILHN